MSEYFERWRAEALARHAAAAAQARADLVRRIKEWAHTNYERSYGASELVECHTDEELAAFGTLAKAKRHARLRTEAYLGAQDR